MENPNIGEALVESVNVTEAAENGVSNQSPKAARPVPSTKRPSFPRHALPELNSQLKAISALPEFADKITSGPFTDPALLLRKVEVYSRWLSRHHWYPPTSQERYVAISHVMTRLGHSGVKPTKAVKAAIENLGVIHGFPSQDGRHNPECEIDRDLDNYQALVLERKKGPPRSAADPTAPCRLGVSHDLSCKPSDLDSIAMKRLRMIMAMEEEPGEIYQPTPEELKLNPAVAVMLRAGLATFAAGLPADPLDPSQIDMITVARVCRVGVPDILRSAEHVALVHAARGSKPLVINPALAARSYTHAELINYGRAERRNDPGGNASPGQAARTSVRALKLFLTTDFADGDLGSRVPHDFSDRVERALFTKPADAGSGWAAEMRRWIRWNAEMRSSKPLPKPFALGLRVLTSEAGLSVADLLKAADGTESVRSWLTGEAVPSMPRESLLTQLDAVLGVEAGTLSGLLADEWRMRRFDASLFEFDDDEGDGQKARQRRARHARHLPIEFEAMSDEQRKEILEDQHWSIVNQDTEFARRSGTVTQDKYRLETDLWSD